MSIKNFSDTIGNRTRDLPACNAVSQPTAPPLLHDRAPPQVLNHAMIDIFLVLPIWANTEAVRKVAGSIPDGVIGMFH